MPAFLDHIAIAAPDLASGTRFVEQALGVALQTGGQHPRMGTHNNLLRLGDDVYLEVIAVDPGAAAPQRPRWFELDLRQPDASPRLTTWVVRVDDIAAARQACSWDTGPVESMTRGTLDWRITIPVDGSLPDAGTSPTLIQWDTQPHPASAQDDKGCTLEALEVFHPAPERLHETIQALGLVGRVEIYPVPAGGLPQLRARIRTPDGVRMLP